jgi:hypothetical protein
MAELSVGAVGKLRGWVTAEQICHRFAITYAQFSTRHDWKIKRKKRIGFNSCRLYWGPDAEKNVPAYITGGPVDRRYKALDDEGHRIEDRQGRVWIWCQAVGIAARTYTYWQKHGCASIGGGKVKIRAIGYVSGLGAGRGERPRSYMIESVWRRIREARAKGPPEVPGLVSEQDGKKLLHVKAFATFHRIVKLAPEIIGHKVKTDTVQVTHEVNPTCEKTLYTAKQLIQLYEALKPDPKWPTAEEAAKKYPKTVPDRSFATRYRKSCFWLDGEPLNAKEAWRLDRNEHVDLVWVHSDEELAKADKRRAEAETKIYRDDDGEFLSAMQCHACSSKLTNPRLLGITRKKVKPWFPWRRDFIFVHSLDECRVAGRKLGEWREPEREGRRGRGRPRGTTRAPSQKIVQRHVEVWLDWLARGKKTESQWAWDRDLRLGYLKFGKPSGKSKKDRQAAKRFFLDHPELKPKPQT